jgi:hypothetical protein
MMPLVVFSLSSIGRTSLVGGEGRGEEAVWDLELGSSLGFGAWDLELSRPVHGRGIKGERERGGPFLLDAIPSIRFHT